MALKWKYKFKDSLTILVKTDFEIAGAEMIKRIKSDKGDFSATPDQQVKTLEECKENLKQLRIEARNDKE